MRPDVLQVVALCSHLNAYLRSEEDRSPELTLVHPAFKTLCELRFIRVQPTGTEAIAEGTSPWMKRQRTEEVVRVFLALEPVTSLDGAEDEAWGVVTDSRRGLEVWHPTWKSRAYQHNDPSPHRVIYSASRYRRWGVTPATSLEATAEKLEATFTSLGEVIPFSTKLPEGEFEIFAPDASPLMRETGRKALSIIGQLSTNATKTYIAKLDAPKLEIIRGALDEARNAVNLAAA